MSHLDEPRLHAFLDGELAPAERSAVETHLAACPACQALYAEARAVAAEADALLHALDPPPAAARSAEPGPRSTSRQARYRTLAWAATVVLATGLGYLASDLRYHGHTAGAGGLGGSALVPAASDLDGREPADSTGPARPAAAAEPARTTAERGRHREAPRAAGERAEVTSPAGGATTGRAGQEELATPEAAGKVNASQRPAPMAADRITVPARRIAPASGARPEDSLGKAGAVTSWAPGEPAKLEAAAPTPPPQDAGVRFRPITMEEAVRLLGGTIRLVDGLVPDRILAESATPADSAAPRVRVVYAPDPGHPIWLDQQRGDPAPGATPRTPTGRDAAWAPQAGNQVTVTPEGGVRTLRWQDQAGFRLSLTGNLPTDSLLALARRVR